jgi:hypothetical protein
MKVYELLILIMINIGMAGFIGEQEGKWIGWIWFMATTVIGCFLLFSGYGSVIMNWLGSEVY